MVESGEGTSCSNCPRVSSGSSCGEPEGEIVTRALRPGTSWMRRVLLESGVQLIVWPFNFQVHSAQIGPSHSSAREVATMKICAGEIDLAEGCTADAERSVRVSLPPLRDHVALPRHHVYVLSVGHGSSE